MAIADATEEVWLERDNVIEWVVVTDDTPVSDLSALTRAVVCVDTVVVDSDVHGSGVIWWTDTVTDKTLNCTTTLFSGDVVRARLGRVTGLAAGEYEDCRLVVFDAASPSGMVISDNITITVHATCIS